MKVAWFAVLMTGCAVCHVHPQPDVPPGIEATAFIDQHEDCWTVAVGPAFLQVLTIAAGIVKLFAGGGAE